MRKFVSDGIRQAVVLGLSVGSALAVATLLTSLLFGRPPYLDLAELLVADYVAGGVAAFVVSIYRRMRTAR